MECYGTINSLFRSAISLNRKTIFVGLGMLIAGASNTALAAGGPTAKLRWTRTYTFSCEQQLPTPRGMRTMEQASTTVCQADTGPAFAANICSNSGQPPVCTCSCYYYTEIPPARRDPVVDIFAAE